MRTVEIHQAFLFTCEDCGRDTFVRAIEMTPEAMEETDLDAETREALARIADAADGAEVGGSWLMVPMTVTCPHCKAEFSTQDHQPDEL